MRRKNSDYHSQCLVSADSPYLEGNRDSGEEQERHITEKGAGPLFLLLHGLPVDWIEEEMGNIDKKLVKEVLENNIRKLLQTLINKSQVWEIQMT